MTQEQLNQTVFFVNSKNEIESCTYQDYLLEYGIDWCTSPRGNTDRVHIREDEWQSKLDDGTYHSEFEYHIWSWGVNGNNPYYLGKTFYDEQEAELYIYDLREQYVREKNWNAPTCFFTHDEAVAELANKLEKPYEVVDRFLRIQEVGKRRKAEEDRIRHLEDEKKRIELEKLVHEEADQLVPDQQFIEDVEFGYSLPKEERSKALSAAFVYFLQRTGYGRIKSDFWKVFRIVSKKQLV